MAQKFIQTNKVLNKLLNNSSQNAPSSSLSLNNGNHTSTSSSITSNQFNHNEYEKLDKKHFDKIYKLAEKSLKYSQAEKMNLTNSPPYIIDILPDICHHLNNIYTAYENKLHILNEIDYFLIYIFNLINKFEQLINLFKHAGKRMYEERSDERKQLIKYSLIFSHILAELKSIFPNNVYDGQNFRIAKADAAEFWKSNFNNRIIVPWQEFHQKLNNVHAILSELEARDLKTNIQLTGTRYVSIFEFDVFTRLFQPWSTLLNNWKFLAFTHPGYGAFMTYDEVFKRLQKHIDKPGSYLFRLSCTKLGQWAIGYVTSDKKILQTIPQSLVQALIDGEKQGLYLYPDGRDVQIDIKSQMAISASERITISKEQYDMYCDMGTSFQLCKICSENNKDRKLEPCGHLICSNCLNSWQEKNGINASCPFCRCEIKAFEPIIINPFQKEQNNEFTTSQISNASNFNAPFSDLEDIDNWSNRSRSINGSPFEPTRSKIISNPDEQLVNLSLDLFENSIQNKAPQPITTTPSSIVSRAKQCLIAQQAANLINLNSEINRDVSDESDFDLETFKDYLKPQTTKPTKLKSQISNKDDGHGHLFVDKDRNSDNFDMQLNSLLLTSPMIPSNQQSIISNQVKAASPNPSVKIKASCTNLQIPNMPPPPLPTQTQQVPNIPPPPTQITNPHSVKIRIENEKLLEQLNDRGYDYTKAACALYLANNNIDIAIEILQNYTSN